jgi:hypothetical protein
MQKGAILYKSNSSKLAFAFAAVLIFARNAALAQSLDDLNIQFHGYATQGFLYTTKNNILTTNSSDGSPAWTEAVVNLTSVPTPNLHMAVQARYSILGTVGNTITLDYAAADYKVNEQVGFRFGKVKVPEGLLNEVQDIDSAYMWSLLPQGVYPTLSRNSLLSLYGGVGYGYQRLGQRFGRLEYRAWGGETVLATNDGYFIFLKDEGINLSNAATFSTVGGAIHWVTPVPGLFLGASDDRYGPSSVTGLAGGVLPATISTAKFNLPAFFGRYEHNRFMFAAEHTRLPVVAKIQLGSYPVVTNHQDSQSWYAMSSFKVTNKFTAGIYQSQSFVRSDPLGPSRYSKDWALSGRYDFNDFVYAKAEQHFIDGTALLYDTANNTGGLSPDTRLSILKIGVSF